MTPARPTPAQHQPPALGELRPSASRDAAYDAGWPMALRALLLLSEAAGDPVLTRVSDEELALLRATFVLLDATEPTSAA